MEQTQLFEISPFWEEPLWKHNDGCGGYRLKYNIHLLFIFKTNMCLCIYKERERMNMEIIIFKIQNITFNKWNDNVTMIQWFDNHIQIGLDYHVQIMNPKINSIKSEIFTRHYELVKTLKLNTMVSYRYLWRLIMDKIINSWMDWNN